ncbi:glycoside hydrolase family 18 protein [Hypoxylon trugodes]|uniref:glycoside hydrolase family 18 protein n=1 Tax=Hypoxylon trugodes TaxID=326681 RepID=UPI0021A17AAA|nr:glycoside hydrolase family 18 protein [Hypoxylon trugodes]KAI1393197.1 glycoside hydrolase family 18 protein [Hypoxylon trugodes]
MPSNRSFVNAVYYPSWRVYKGLPPSTMQLDYINRIYYAFVRLNSDGSLRFLDEFADCNKEVDGEKGCLGAIAKLKRQRPGLQTLVSVGGGSGSAEFPDVAADPKRRATFADSCRQFVDQYEFDGVDLDWEHPTTAEEGENYLALLNDLRDVLPSSQYLLATALPTGEYCLKHINVKAAAQLLDTLNLMAYDFNGPWTDVSGHHAQLLPPPGRKDEVDPALRNSCHIGVDRLLSRGFPASKIVLGVPVYARSFAGARDVGQSFTSATELDYNDLPRHWIRSASVNPNVAAASYIDDGREGKGFVSFDVPETVRRKAEYARGMGLGGLFFWTGVGDVNGPESLVRAGYEGLKNL